LDVTATLLRSVEKFARKVEQLSVIKEVGILVALAGTCWLIIEFIVDSTVTLYDLQKFELLEHLTKTKGANIFAVASNIEKDADGVPTIVSRLAVIVKRKLLVYSWHDAELIDPEVCLQLISAHVPGVFPTRPSENRDMDVFHETLSGAILRFCHPGHQQWNLL